MTASDNDESRNNNEDNDGGDLGSELSVAQKAKVRRANAAAIAADERASQGWNKSRKCLT